MGKITIRSLREGENDYSGCWGVRELDLDLEDISLVGEVSLQGVVTKVIPRLLFHGTLSFGIEYECARCLKKGKRDFRASIRWAFEQREELKPGWEIATDVRYIRSSDPELDLLPEIRETVLFVLPTVLLCREDCPGLCPRCGWDLSEGPCDCPPMEKDSPWGVLKSSKSIE